MSQFVFEEVTSSFFIPAPAAAVSLLTEQVGDAAERIKDDVKQLLSPETDKREVETCNEEFEIFKHKAAVFFLFRGFNFGFWSS